jgi:hypothetical protein
MKRGGKMFICLAGGIALTMSAKAITGNPTSIKQAEAGIPIAGTNSGGSTNDVGDTPYSAIVERNIFDLKDPPPPPPPMESNAPPANVSLTGLMTIFGKKQALFMVQKQMAPGKGGGAPPAAESYIMTEGQRQDGLEVLEIDVTGKKVKIKNDGTVSTITFEVAKAGGGGVPMNPTPHMGMGKPGFIPNYPNTPATPLPTRPIRTPDFSQYSPQGNSNPGGAGYNPQAGYNPGGVSAVGYNQGQPQQQALSGDEQVAMFLAQQKAHAADEAAGRYPPAPPIPGITTPQQPVGSGQSGGEQFPPTSAGPPPPPIGSRVTGTLR